MQRTNFNNRKSMRHPNRNYSSSNMYFVTICVDNFVEYFGEIQSIIVGDGRARLDSTII